MFFYEGISISDSLIMAGFLASFCWLVVANPRILILSILLINLGLSAASFYFLELGGYITELGRFSYRTNNLFFHLSYVLFFLSAFVFFSSQISRLFAIHPSDKKHEVNIYSGINLLIGMILLLVIVLEYSSLSLYGIPIIQGQNKVDVAASNVVVMYLEVREPIFQYFLE